MTTKNVIFFGQSGAGKSSVINLIAGRKIADISLDADRCTLQWQDYPIDIDGYSYNVFDTVGVEDHQLGMKEYLEAIMSTYNLVKKLDDEGGIHLLLFCVRAGRFASNIRNNYRLFYEWLCNKKVPIVLVITGLEGEEKMENWWGRSGHRFKEIIVDDHACITAINGRDPKHQELYTESCRLVCDFIVRYTRSSHDGASEMNHGYNGGDRDEGGDGDKKSKWGKLKMWGKAGKGADEWFRRLVHKMKELFPNISVPKEAAIIDTLTTRCGVPNEAAKQLANQIKKDFERK